MKQKHKIAHMKSAFNYAECSTASRLQVGCVLVKDNRIISIGYNGMPSGWTNECETEDNVTKPEVLHAETNAIQNAQGDLRGAIAYVTHKPCSNCCGGLIQAGISKIVSRPTPKGLAERLKELYVASEAMMKEAGIEFVEI